MITISTLHEVELKVSQKPAVLRDRTTVTILVINAESTMKAIEAAAEACSGQRFPADTGTFRADTCELIAVRPVQPAEYTLTTGVRIVEAPKPEKKSVPIMERHDWSFADN